MQKSASAPADAGVAAVQELLELLAEHTRRVPLALVAIVAVLAALAWDTVPHPAILAWVAAVFGLRVVRDRGLVVLAERRDLDPDWRLRAAVGLSVLSGLSHAAALAAFPMFDLLQRTFVTLVLLALCAGAVGTTAGHRPTWLGYALPVVGPLPLLWAFVPPPDGEPHTLVARSLSLLIVLYAWVLLGVARASWRTFSDSVRIRFQERELNRQLRDALLDANTANQAKTRFLAAASHDLRQPLHTIGLLVAALSLRRLDGRDREIVGLLTQVTMALSEQLDSLLDISRLDAGVVQVDTELVNLSELLMQLHAEVQAPVAAKGLRLSLQVAPGLHARSDGALLTRVVRNLADNALKFTEHGTVTLALRQDGQDACITVSDTGVGIPAEQQSLVFEEFYQVGNPERDRERGLGLGLSIVRRLTRLLGVRLSMQSVLGEGTTFELRLPLAAPPLPAARTCVDAGDDALGLRVLVLDDERSVRTGLRLLLEELGCSCAEAADQAEALQAARHRRPDIVLADMQLRHNGNGIAAIHAIRAEVGPVPALLISGDTSPERLREADRAGIRLLHKPVALQVLQAQMRIAIAEAARG